MPSPRWTAEDERNYTADRTVLKKLQDRGEEPSQWLADEYKDLSERRRQAKRRRPKGEGAVYQRGDGMWCVSVELPEGLDGKRRRKVICRKSKEDAAAELKKMKAELASSPVPAIQGREISWRGRSRRAVTKSPHWGDSQSTTPQ